MLKWNRKYWFVNIRYLKREEFVYKRKRKWNKVTIRLK
jgi:hypothetical protein